MTMTDKQKLQQLFDAALKTHVPNEGLAPKRAFPTPTFEIPSEFASNRTPASAPAPAPFGTPVPAPVSAQAQAPAVVTAPAPAIFEKVEAAVESGPESPELDREAAEELGALLDERIARKRRRRKLELVVTLVLFFGTTGGGAAWFVQSPVRMQALREAIRDVRSYGDIKSMVAKYQEYINKIGVRNKQIDQASSVMGVDLAKVDRTDDTMDAEMKQLMGKEGGKTLGDRNKAMHAAFGDRVKDAGGTLKANVAVKENESFNWK
jgi:hypothetical protein